MRRVFLPLAWARLGVKALPLGSVLAYLAHQIQALRGAKLLHKVVNVQDVLV